VVLALFFCSGATALIYEVIWSKFLSLMFGSTIQAPLLKAVVSWAGAAMTHQRVGRISVEND